jgi:hypothetical protein
LKTIAALRSKSTKQYIVQVTANDVDKNAIAAAKVNAEQVYSTALLLLKELSKIMKYSHRQSQNIQSLRCCLSQILHLGNDYLQKIGLVQFNDKSNKLDSVCHDLQ